MTIFDKKIKTNNWIADSGLSGHMVNQLEGFTKVKTKKPCTVLSGNGNLMAIQKTGIWKGTINSLEGKEIPFILQDIDYLPKLMCNLLSTLQMQKNGWKVIREKDNFRI